ncbi:curli production assembly/transport component CsgF [Vibrio variabilis]|uniref:Curli production assembly/transport component CsgF n=1 Tax=Vibrio variabilis TaxID=990271 RepID=A0ABQ0JMC3_9VIBR|nr:curli production assembly/transport component CsgF [Vibrio variabilis]
MKHTTKYLLIAALTTSGVVNGTELIYTPINPSFGGNPLNSTILINHANAINDYTDPNSGSSFDFESDSALDRLAERLESQLINQLFSEVGNGNSGQLETDNFILNIVDGGSGGVTIQLFDKITGESSEILVSGINQLGDLNFVSPHSKQITRNVL